MPSMAPITAKNAAAANAVFEVVTPSGGDGTPAIWELRSAGSTVISRPRAEMVSRPNADRTARKVFPSLVVPYVVTDSVTGLQKVVANVVIRNGEITIPRTVPDNIIADAVAYWASLNASALWVDSYKFGYAPV